MTHTRLLPALLAALVLAACARSPQASPSPSPQPSPSAAPAPAPAPAPATAAGAYDFTTSVQGQEISGTVTITGSPGSYGGSVATSATPELPIRSVTVEGQTITVTADTPEGEAMIQMTMAGMDFSGSWSYAGQGGTLRGRKRG